MSICFKECPQMPIPFSFIKYIFTFAHPSIYIITPFTNANTRTKHMQADLKEVLMNEYIDGSL